MVKDAPRTERESPERGTNYIGRYEIKARSGEGAFGIVYRAHDPLLDRTVAIKVPRADSLQTLEVQLVVEEFRHEAKVAGKFAHENVVTIYDVVSDSGLDYIVMEYVRKFLLVNIGLGVCYELHLLILNAGKDRI